MVRLCRNRWQPDTCGCEVEFEFDDDADAVERKHKLVKIHKACKAHADLHSYLNRTFEDAAVPFHQENKRKNMALDAYANALGLPNDETRHEKTSQNLAKWYFDENRILHIVSKGLTKTKITQVHNQLAEKFGEKTVVE